jgi:hypothetical protein
MQQHPERRLDQFRHGSALAGGLLLELGDDRVIDVQSGLHMDNHTGWMGICPGVEGFRGLRV